MDVLKSGGADFVIAAQFRNEVSKTQEFLLCNFYGAIVNFLQSHLRNNRSA